MPPDKIAFPQLPFLTREMLKFGASVEMDLQVVSYSDRADTVELIGFTREGIFKFDVTQDAGGGVNIKTFRIPDVPISLSISTESASSKRGEYYIVVYLRINGERVYQLCAGYVTRQSGVNFPQTHSDSELSKKGAFIIATGTNPAAGADWKIDIDSDKIWRLQAVIATLTTDANAADRRVHLQLGPGTNAETRMVEAFGSVNHTASLARKYTFAAFGGLPAESDDNDLLINIPKDLIFSASSDIQTETVNIQVGDQWSSIAAIVEEWIQD